MQPTFDNFIVGEPCRAALMAAREVARYPGTRYNPLFLFGGTGTGKTHLLRAIAGEITARDPSAQVYSETYAAFAARLRAAVEGGDAASLRERFSYYDAFLLDDLSDDEGWVPFQREVVAWIDRYVREERQVVLTSSRSISRLLPLEERFLSRVRHGLVVPLGGIDRGVREAVASRMLEGEGLSTGDEALRILGDLPVTDMREMIGIVNRVAIALRAEGADPSPSWLTTALQRLMRDGEIRRFRVGEREVPPFGTGVTRVEVAVDGGAGAPVFDGTGTPAGVEEGDGQAPADRDGVREQEWDGIDGGEAFAFDESEGYVLDWDREEDRLLNEL